MTQTTDKDYHNIEKIRTQIAKAINLCEAAHETIAYLHEFRRDWDMTIISELETAMHRLGVCLATFDTWYDDDSEEQGNEN